MRVINYVDFFFIFIHKIYIVYLLIMLIEFYFCHKNDKDKTS